MLSGRYDKRKLVGSAKAIATACSIVEVKEWVDDGWGRVRALDWGTSGARGRELTNNTMKEGEYAQAVPALTPRPCQDELRRTVRCCGVVLEAEGARR